MDRNQAKELLPIIKAFGEGEDIEIRSKNPHAQLNGWAKMDEFIFGNFEYRIKPEPAYRPFANAEECWAEMLKHQPFGWIKSKEDGSLSLITLIISEEDIDINCIGGFNSDKIMKRFTFADGAVFGILEEE